MLPQQGFEVAALDDLDAAAVAGLTRDRLVRT
jgi:hypothetical protein